MTDLICPICKYPFSSKVTFDRHKRKEIPCSPPVDKHICTYCSKAFSNKANLAKHLGGRCRRKREIELKQEILSEVKKEIELIEKKPGQVINIVCLGGQHDYLQTLTDQYGDFSQAIDFVRNCALADIQGDCRMIRQIHGQGPFRTPLS